MPDKRMKPQSIWSPTGILQEAGPLMVWVPRSMI